MVFMTNNFLVIVKYSLHHWVLKTGCSGCNKVIETDVVVMSELDVYLTIKES